MLESLILEYSVTRKDTTIYTLKGDCICVEDAPIDTVIKRYKLIDPIIRIIL